MSPLGSDSVWTHEVAACSEAGVLKTGCSMLVPKEGDLDSFASLVFAAVGVVS